MQKGTDELNCRHAGRCGGCPWAGRSLKDQQDAKVLALKGLFPGAQVVFEAAARVRDRADLVWEDGRLGIYDLDTKGTLDLEECPMMSLGLERFFLEFKARRPPIHKGSVRLRVSARGEKGVWLDFANQDIKNLFEEREYLKWLSDLAFVEIGQRRKALLWKDGAPKLGDPILKNWFDSFDPQNQPIPLYGPVGGFSQAGLASNQALVSSVSRAAIQSGTKEWVELFAGNGNLAVGLASHGFTVEAVELDELAVAGLHQTLAQRPDLKAKIQISRGDVYLKPDAIPNWENRGLLVDPPRAGLRQILQRLSKGQPPKALIYVSCFTEVFVEEAKSLLQLGYRLQSLEGVDQFPHSPHCEWIGLFVFDPGTI